MRIIKIAEKQGSELEFASKCNCNFQLEYLKKNIVSQENIWEIELKTFSNYFSETIHDSLREIIIENSKELISHSFHCFPS